jgi:hypothetical protein
VPRGGAVLAADVAAPPTLSLVRHECRALPRRVAHLVAPAALPAPALGLERAGVAHGALGRQLVPVVARRVRFVLVRGVPADLVAAAALAVEVFGPGVHADELVSDDVAHCGGVRG